MSETECPLCGNGVERGRPTCPFCGGAIPRPVSAEPEARERYRTVNLKHDMPTVEECRLRLDHELARARRDGVIGLKLIHGYGASGVGGELRYAVRAVLEGLEATGKIAAVVPGEEIVHQRGSLLRRVPGMKGDRDFRKSNPGVTLVLFS